MRFSEIILNEERKVRLTVLLQEVGGEFAPIDRRPAILVLPGGGYAMCSDREADPVALAYARAGYQTFILRYSTGKYKTWPNPLNDYEQAMELNRGNADEWHLDAGRVAVVGFSAGGHLAACAATVAKNRPNAAILGYAALTKEIADACQPGMPYPVECADDKTPPCFLFATRDDNVVDIRNTIDFQRSLADRGVNFEAHIYSFGMHGFSTAEPYVNQVALSSRVKNWVQDSIDWLAEVWGAFTGRGFGKPMFYRTVNTDMLPMLSLDCTVGHLRQQNETVQNLLKDVFEALEALIQAKFENLPAARAIIDHYKARNIIQMLQIPAEITEQLDDELRKIENKQLSEEVV